MCLASQGGFHGQRQTLKHAATSINHPVSVFCSVTDLVSLGELLHEAPGVLGLLLVAPLEGDDLAGGALVALRAPNCRARVRGRAPELGEDARQHQHDSESATAQLSSKLLLRPRIET